MSAWADVARPESSLNRTILTQLFQEARFLRYQQGRGFGLRGSVGEGMEESGGSVAQSRGVAGVADPRSGSRPPGPRWPTVGSREVVGDAVAVAVAAVDHRLAVAHRESVPSGLEAAEAPVDEAGGGVGVEEGPDDARARKLEGGVSGRAREPSEKPARAARAPLADLTSPPLSLAGFPVDAVVVELDVEVAGTGIGTIDEEELEGFSGWTSGCSSRRRASSRRTRAAVHRSLPYVTTGPARVSTSAQNGAIMRKPAADVTSGSGRRRPAGRRT